MKCLMIAVTAALGVCVAVLLTGCEEEVWIADDFTGDGQTSLTVLALRGRFIGTVRNGCDTQLAVEFPELQSGSPDAKLKSYEYGGDDCSDNKPRKNKGNVAVAEADFRVWNAEGWYDGTATEIKYTMVRDGNTEIRSVTGFNLNNVKYSFE